MQRHKILTIHEVRRQLEEVYRYLEMFNCHSIDNSIDGYDYDNMRKAWQILQDVNSSKWTNQIL